MTAMRQTIRYRATARLQNLKDEISRKRFQFEELELEIEGMEDQLAVTERLTLVDRKEPADYLASFEDPKECPNCHSSKSQFWKDILSDVLDYVPLDDEAYEFRCVCGLVGECYLAEGVWYLGVTLYRDKNQLELTGA